MKILIFPKLLTNKIRTENNKTFKSLLLVWWLILIQKSSQYSVDAAGIENQREAYFNGSVYLRLLTPMTLWTHSAISFRSCRGEYRFF